MSTRILRSLLFLCSLIVLINLNAQDQIYSFGNYQKTYPETNHFLKYSQTVYVCTGAYAYTYHSRSNCPGLGNCKGEIRYTNESYAVNNMNRVPCCRCWSNVSGRCKDDNPYNSGNSAGGANNSEAYAVLAIAFIATSVAILSNDFYIYRAHSFHKSKKFNTSISDLTGWVFGFRKTFKNSALEYGASYFKSHQHLPYSFLPSAGLETDRWGGHFNFVHQVFYNKSTNWLKLYFGPSVNYVYDLGMGGIVGTEIRLFDRLKLDVRYELTSQTNQIQAGLILTYQKEYFWKK
jgi:hypothetical protein